jgi:hypothetical protein
MRALAGPAMLLVLVGGFGLYRLTSAPDSPSRDFLDLELAGADEEQTGACYSLSTVIVANTAFDTAALEWKPASDEGWTLSLDDLQHGTRGPTHVFQRFTFRQQGDQVHLVAVEASEGRNTQVNANIDALLVAPHERRSTPVDRCRGPGASGYQYRRK